MELQKSSRKVQEVLNKFGLDLKVKQLPKSTRTSKQAAETLGCELGQIAKSIVFDSDGPVLVIASGKNRIDTGKMEEILGEEVTIMNPTKVKEVTGFGIGGVPPVGHKTEMVVLIDEDLFDYEVLWAAAGTPKSVFPLTPDDLLKITGGRVVDVKV